MVVRAQGWFALRRSLSSASPPAPPVGRGRGGSRLRKVGLAALGVSGLGYGLVQANIHHPTLLPAPLRPVAIGFEGAYRFFKTAYYIIPPVIEWTILQKWHAKRIDPAELEIRQNEAHARTAAALLNLIRSQGGVFIKSGQHLCASPVVPKVYVETLRVLMDNAIPRALSETERTWREEFGTELLKEFPAFNSNPIATASLAQVYEAFLADGQKVAIKFQHRDVARLFEVDLAIAKFYYYSLAKIFPSLDFTFMVDEVERAFKEELDFELEARNGKKAQRLFQKLSSPIVVPGVIDRFSSRKVLTMEFEEGVRIDDVEAMRRMGISTASASRELISLFSKMMFIDGFVHCDPHPGNILIRPAKNRAGCQIILLDHGTYQHLPEDIRYNYAKIWKSVITADAKGIEEATVAFGIDPKYSRFIGFLLTFSPPTKDPLIADPDSFSPDEIREMVSDFVDIRDHEKAQEQMAEYSEAVKGLPRSLLLILKTNNLLRFINDQLGTPINRYSVMGKYCIQGMTQVNQRRRPGLLTRLWSYYEIFKVQLFILSHPLLQWAAELYLGTAFPSVKRIMDRKRKDGLSFTIG